MRARPARRPAAGPRSPAGWKLAEALRGGPDRLDTYQSERRPLAVLAGEQARLRTDFFTRYGIRTPDNQADLDAQVDSDAVMTTYRYGPIGTRFPHAWVADGVSTLDLIGPGWTLFAGPEWPGAERPVHVLDLTPLGLGPDGAVLVRPDGFVAGRSDHGLTPVVDSSLGGT